MLSCSLLLSSESSGWLTRLVPPIRADVGLSMTVLTYNDLPLTHPGYWTFMAHQVVKEALATVASVDNIGSALGEDVDLLRL